jgi:integrase
MDLTKASFAALLDLAESRFRAWQAKKLRPKLDGLISELHRQDYTLKQRAIYALQIYRKFLEREVRDLRHTGCTRMLEAGVPFPVLAMLMGWSPATTVRMAKRYGHIGQKALRTAVEAISSPAPSASAETTEKPQGSFDNPFDLNRENGTNVPKI